MRTFLAVLALPIVHGCEQIFYSDEACTTASLEVEQGKGSKAKTTYSASPAWIPGRCLKFGEPIKYKYETETGFVSETEMGATWGVTGSELGGSSYYGFGTDRLDGDNACAWNAKKSVEAAKPKTDWMQMYNVGSTNLCVASIGGDGGFQHKSDNGPSSKDGYSHRVLCGPVPGAVWGIVLSSIGLVLSFAGLGLAAAAGK